jgi:hypothetical protein
MFGAYAPGQGYFGQGPLDGVAPGVAATAEVFVRVRAAIGTVRVLADSGTIRVRSDVGTIRVRRDTGTVEL